MAVEYVSRIYFASMRTLADSSVGLSFALHDNDTGSLALTGSVVEVDVSSHNISCCSEQVFEILPADVWAHLNRNISRMLNRAPILAYSGNVETSRSRWSKDRRNASRRRRTTSAGAGLVSGSWKAGSVGYSG